MSSRVSITLWFFGHTKPSLAQIRFLHPLNKIEITAVRGKTGGASESKRTFQWTSAVQGLSILFLRTLAFSEDALSDGESPMLMGERGSLAASLDEAISKKTQWLKDMFGADSKGELLVKRIIKRTNSGMKRSGPVRIGLNDAAIDSKCLSVYLDGRTLETKSAIYNLLRDLEMSCGAVTVLDTVASSPSSRRNLTPSPSIGIIASHSIEQSLRGTFKTPFVKHSTRRGHVHARIYRCDNATALVAVYPNPEKLLAAQVSCVRVQHACISSELFLSHDCDCHTQMNLAFKVLEEKGGVLIHFVEDDYGVGIFDRYTGIASAQLGATNLVNSLLPSTTESSSHDLQYGLARYILKDLGLSKISLLTNNPLKTAALCSDGLEVEATPLLGDLTPQNIGFLLNKLTLGQLPLDALFSAPSNLFTVFEPADNSRFFQRCWLFDTDDTLWESNLIYEDLIRRFMDHCSLSFPAVKRDYLRDHIDQVGLGMITRDGLGASSFERTLRKVYADLSSAHVPRAPNPEDILDRVIPTIEAIPREVNPIIQETIRRLRERGDGVILFAEGERQLQLARIARSNLAPFAHGIAICQRKTMESYRKLLEQLPFRYEEVVAVGNSLRNDIAPAVNLGLRCFHYKNPNARHLMEDIAVPPGSYGSCASLLELVNFA